MQRRAKLLSLVLGSHQGQRMLAEGLGEVLPAARVRGTEGLGADAGLWIPPAQPAAPVLTFSLGTKGPSHHVRVCRRP